MKKTFAKILSSCLAVLTLTACGTAATSASSSVADTSPALKDDFYTAVNADWMASAVIPADMPVTGGFIDLSDEIESILMDDFAMMLNGEKEAENSELNYFLDYYKQTLDFEKRDADGAAPLLPHIQRIEALQSMADFEKNWVEWALDGMFSPFSFSVMADMGNAAQNGLYASSPGLFLPDKSYYEDAATKELMMGAYTQMLTNLLVLAGKTEAEAATIVQQAVEFDALLVPYAKTAEEASDFTALYNPMDIKEFYAFSNNFDFETQLTSLLGKNLPAQVIVTDPSYFKALDEVLNEENFEIMKSWVLVQTVQVMSPYLSDDFRIEASSFSMVMSGISEPSPKEKDAFALASNQFNEVVGIYYGETYFGEEAKQDVVHMVDNMIAVYKTRLENNTWLSDETRATAIKKLEQMTINVGYPDAANSLYSQMISDKDATLLENTMAFSRIMRESNYADLANPVNRTEWPLGAHVVNAMYSPMNNSINFPAAILQAPFYSLEQSASANYGGIGAVIAHEISHAFDPNGSKFDELGNLANWWTDEDYATFEELSLDMINQFEGIEYAGGAVNGALTVTENVADAGGLSCALEAVKKEEDVDLEAFFTNWAVIWRLKATPEYEMLLLTMDVHAPNKLRANVQLQNIEDFYTTFDIKEEDGMYLAPEKRVSIW